MTEIQTPTPRNAFELLMAGNQRFVLGTVEHPNQDASRRTETAPSQKPFAVLFGCSDSPLAAEIIFDRYLRCGLSARHVDRTNSWVFAGQLGFLLASRHAR